MVSPRSDVSTAADESKKHTKNGAVLNHEALNRAIGSVAVALGHQDEFLRDTLAGLTDVNFSDVLFEGLSSEQLAGSLKSILGEMYHWIERYGPYNTHHHDTTKPYAPHTYTSSNY
jgi:hypothetical protein